MELQLKNETRSEIPLKNIQKRAIFSSRGQIWKQNASLCKAKNDRIVDMKPSPFVLTKGQQHHLLFLTQ